MTQIKLKLELDVQCLLLSTTHETMDDTYDLVVHNSTSMGSLTEAEARIFQPLKMDRVVSENQFCSSVWNRKIKKNIGN
jgi:hypothetical protein